MRGEEIVRLTCEFLSKELPPHARRRESWLAVIMTTKAELPPHARRREMLEKAIKSARGITSACAEKRPATMLDATLSGNYLRMRGEE